MKQETDVSPMPAGLTGLGEQERSWPIDFVAGVMWARQVRVYCCRFPYCCSNQVCTRMYVYLNAYEYMYVYVYVYVNAYVNAYVC